MSRIKTAARYRHDCENDCLYLGPYGEYDLYVHQDSGNYAETVIARKSSEPSDYVSGILAAKRYPELHEALKRSAYAGIPPRPAHKR